MREDGQQGEAEDSSGQPGSLGGDFLISNIDLADPNFFRSVILMITHDETGAFGLVVNHPSRFTLGEVIEGMESSEASGVPIYIGGPVQREALFVLHGPGPWYEAPVSREQPIDGVIFEPATAAMMEFLGSEWSGMPDGERPAVRIYAGYSGWAPGQVEGELETESWVVVPATRSIVFHANPQAAWAEAFAGKGPLYKIILQTGFKPSMN